MEEGDSGRIPVLKIKIPKKTGAGEEEDVRSHYCKECDRSFSSGKALGGHMSSAHVQANKECSRSPKSKSSPGSPSWSCSICGRVFQSQKSLFGHMRCHPEREWRGMEPPRDAKVKACKPSLDAEEVLASGKMERKYRCDTCGMVFKSHEALGGHRASHTKFKMIIINTCTRHLEPKKTPKPKKPKLMTKPEPGTSDHVDGDGDSASTITPTLASGFAFGIDLNKSPPREEEEEEEEVEDKSSNDTSSRR